MTRRNRRGVKGTAAEEESDEEKAQEKKVQRM
jgi:hypothetical protein